MTFRAENAAGSACTGVVMVCVPHDRQSNACVDEGHRYDSRR
jgi:hypothetical protein